VWNSENMWIPVSKEARSDGNELRVAESFMDKEWEGVWFMVCGVGSLGIMVIVWSVAIESVRSIRLSCGKVAKDNDGEAIPVSVMRSPLW